MGNPPRHQPDPAQAGEEKYKNLLQSIPDIVYKLDAAGNFLFVNDSVRILGYDPEELIGKHFSVIVHPDDAKSAGRAEVLPKFEGRSTGDEGSPKLFDERRTGKRMTRNLEIRLVPKNRSDPQFGGVFSYGEIIATGQFRPDVSARDKRYLGTVGIIRDVTVRRRQERLLYQQKTAMDVSMDGIAIVDPNGRLAYVNASFVKMYGFDRPEEIVGRSWEILYGEEELKRFKAEITPKFAKHGYWRGEAVALRRNGEAFPEEITMNALECGGFVCVDRDISHRKLAEKIIHEREERFRALTESANDAILSANGAGVIIHVNPAAETIFGYPAREIMGKPLTVLMPDRFHDMHRQGIARFLETGEGRLIGKTVELTGKRKDGGEFPLEISLSAWKQSGQTLFTAIIRDISDRKQMEQKQKVLHQDLIQSEKMRALGEILSGAAHELNNPLTAILGYAQLMQTAASLEEIKSDLNAVSQEAKRCSAIVQNLVAFARKRGPKREPCRINELISDTLKLRSYQMTVDNIQLAVHLDDQIPATMADPQQLQQVFLNIINNAMQSMEKSPARHLAVSSRLETDACRITIQDSGPGIPADLLTRIFEPFFTTKEVGKGTGLGLSLCYGIVSEHGGKIWAESGSDSSTPGTAFIIELPVIPPPVFYEAGKDMESGRISSEKKVNILVVDDEESCRTVLNRYFGKKGCRVTAVDSVPKAILELDRTKFSLIVSDHKMPGGSGEELYDHLQAHHPDLVGKFILITGDILNPSSSRFIEKTKVRVLEKPFELETLSQILSDMLQPDG